MPVNGTGYGYRMYPRDECLGEAMGAGCYRVATVDELEMMPATVVYHQEKQYADVMGKEVESVEDY